MAALSLPLQFAMAGEHDGWEATLTDSGGSKNDGRYELTRSFGPHAAPLSLIANRDVRCRYTSKDLQDRGATPNDVSSLVVHYGDEGSALTMQKDVKDKRAAGLPQRGQIDALDWSNFDEYMQVRNFYSAQAYAVD